MRLGFKTQKESVLFQKLGKDLSPLHGKEEERARESFKGAAKTLGKVGSPKTKGRGIRKIGN